MRDYKKRLLAAPSTPAITARLGLAMWERAGTVEVAERCASGGTPAAVE